MSDHETDSAVQRGQLTWFRRGRAPRGVILLLHGGQKHSHEPVRYWHASWWRMALIGWAVRGFARRHGLAVALLRNRVRGWNDPGDPDPVIDARAALGSLRQRFGDIPVALVGHSMGGRTACRAAADPAVLGVCALAPWLPASTPTDALRGRSLHVLHGTADRWTSPALSREFVERCRPVSPAVSWTSMPDVGHFMLRRVGEWNAFVANSVAQILHLTASVPAANEGTE